MLKFLLLIGALLLPVSAYAGAGPDIDDPLTVKCGTPEILARLDADGYRPMSLERYINVGDSLMLFDDYLPRQAVSAEGNFRAHYTDTGINAPPSLDTDENGVPDYVDSTLVYLEYAWDLTVNQLGYDAPRSDAGRGGGDEVDIYILNMYGYGSTTPDFSGPSSSYIQIDNNFSGPQYSTKEIAAVRVTTAHEFFHVIQFSYINDHTNLIWWMEQTAVWMEERAWDDVNDYLSYLWLFFGSYSNLNNRNLAPLDNGNTYPYSNHMYGAGIWPMYLAQRFGDDVIKNIWEHLYDSGVHNVSVFDDVIPGGLPAAFNEFAVWNYFVGSRANSHFHHDAELFNTKSSLHDVVDLVYSTPPAMGAIDANHLTSRYIEFQFTNDQPVQELTVALSPLYGDFTSTIVFYNSPEDYLIEPLNMGDNTIPLDRSWNCAAIVASCTNTSGTGFSIEFDGDLNIITLAEETAPLAFAVSPAQPNPFNPATTIGFTMPSDGDVAVTAYNLQGQAVDEIARGFFPAGNHQVVWRPGGLAGGVYLIRVATPQGVKTIKSLYLK